MSNTGPETVRKETYSTIVIECPTRCVDQGCMEHLGQEWRTSKRLPGGTSIEKGLEALEDYSRDHPGSGPYRLAYYVTTIKTTVEVWT